MSDDLDREITGLVDDINWLEAEISNVRSSINNCKNTLRNLHAAVNSYDLNRGIIGPATAFLDEVGISRVANEAAVYAEDTVRRAKT